MISEGDIMNRIFLALAVTAVTTLSGCNDYDGKFVAKKDLKFKHTTLFGNEKTKKLDKGVYKASFKGMASGKVKFSFSGDDNLDVKLKMPDGVELPSGDGSFYLLAEESGQNADTFTSAEREGFFGGGPAGNGGSGSTKSDVGGCTTTDDANPSLMLLLFGLLFGVRRARRD